MVDLPAPFLVGRIIGLARLDDGWVPALLDLLRRLGSLAVDEDPLRKLLELGILPTVDEEDLLRVLPYGEVEGQGAPVRLAGLPGGKPRMLDSEATGLPPGTVFRDRLADGSEGRRVIFPTICSTSSTRWSSR